MRHRRLASLLAAVTVAGLAATGCGSTSAAVQVDDESISQPDFEDELEVVYENETFRTALFGQVGQEQLRGEDAPLGSFTQAYVSGMAFVQIQFMVVPGILEAEDVEVTDEDVAGAEADVESEVPGAFDGVPAGMKDRYVEAFASFDKLQTELGAEFEPVLMAAIQAADIRVSSRYGTWNPDDLTVDPPAGPRPAPGSGSSSTGLPADGSDLPAG